MKKPLKIALIVGGSLLVALAVWLVYTGLTYGGEATLGLP